jgi:hypothetical protein
MFRIAREACARGPGCGLVNAGCRRGQILKPGLDNGIFSVLALSEGAEFLDFNQVI